MPAPNPLAIFAPRLNQLGVRWMAVGSIAANATANCAPPSTWTLSSSSGPTMRSDHETGFKADIYLATSEPLQQWAWERRRELSVAGTTAWIAPPEYVIIGKLEFYREGRSEKHIRDVQGILALTTVDRDVLAREIMARGLGEIWRQVVPSKERPET